jgi:hypothetical protein
LNTDAACGPCTSPPPNDCTGAQPILFANPGTCVGARCQYSSTTQAACQFGCYLGHCTGQLTTFNNQAAYESGTANLVNIQGGTASAANSVSVIVQTAPRGSAQIVELFYTTDGTTNNPTTLTMSADPLTPSNATYQQWYVIIPQQPAGTTVIFWMRATGWDGTILFNSNFSNNWSYHSQ